MASTAFLAATLRAVIALLLWVSSSSAAVVVSVSVADGSRAPIKDVLVILQPLDPSNGEISRSLTDSQGHITPVKVAAGLYRAIASTPYGLWETKITEFLANGPKTDVILFVTPQPTHGYGDIVSIGNPLRRVHVLRSTGEPAANAAVYVRDRNATLHLERRYKTDLSGNAQIELVSNPTVVIAVSEGSLLSEEITEETKTDRKPITLQLPPPPRN